MAVGAKKFRRHTTCKDIVNTHTRSTAARSDVAHTKHVLTMADEDPITQVEGEPAPASPLTEYSVVYTDRALNL